LFEQLQRHVEAQCALRARILRRALRARIFRRALRARVRRCAFARIHVLLMRNSCEAV